MDWHDIKALVPLPGADPDYAGCRAVHDYSGWLAAFPQLELAKTTPQSPIYHAEGDVWTHTCMVADALISHPDWQSASRSDQEVLFIAAMLHDVAKCSTTQVDPDTGAISLGTPARAPLTRVLPCGTPACRSSSERPSVSSYIRTRCLSTSWPTPVAAARRSIRFASSLGRWI